MPYCLSCGKLRPTRGGFCDECKIDEYVKREPDRKIAQMRKQREAERAAERAAFSWLEKE